MSNFICFDLEGPLSPQDNAYDLMKLFPNGDRIFEVISRYDDLLTLEERESYEPGDTLTLIVPFLVLHNITEDNITTLATKVSFTGGAAISREVAEFIDNIGITVYEGYGLSETSPIATVNSPGHQKIGSVGKPVEDVEIIIDMNAGGGPNEGEILIKGPNVMQGYHNLEQQTKEALREDGAFHSGDLGWIDDEGFVYVTGRIKEQYKLENGKYVAPAPLEEQLKLSGYIDQVLVFGDNKPFNVAIIVPDVVALEGWAKEKGLEGDLKSFFDNPGVKELYASELERWSQDVFKGFEKVRDFRLITEEFSTDNDMLTPTLKLKRRNVIMTYQSILDDIYSA